MKTRLELPVSEVSIGPHKLSGLLSVPEAATGLVLFAHGSGSSRLSPRNQFVARELQRGGLGTLLFDLLAMDEAEDRRKVFDIDLLAERLAQAADWVGQQDDLSGMRLGFFGASTGAAAALVAAAGRSENVGAIVSRGGRPDLAERYLGLVKAPTLLIVGGDDEPVIEMNQYALDLLNCEKQLEVIPGATHLFSEPGTLEQVARLAREWFQKHLGGH